MTRSYRPPIGAQLGLIAETLHRADGLENARNQVPGQSSEFKFGAQDAISSAQITIWDVAEDYTYLAAAIPLTISSPNAADQLTGTGARTVKIFGLDANYAEINETVTLASVTAVTTTQSYLRVNRMWVMTAGSGNQNAGIVYAGSSTVTTGTPADKSAAINAGENQTLMALYTVPAGKTAFLRRWAASSGATAANLGVTARLRIREFAGLFRTRDKRSAVRSVVQLKYEVPISIPEKSDIQITGIRAAGADVDGSASFDLILRNN